MNDISEPGNLNAQLGPVAAAQEERQCLDDVDGCKMM